MAIFLNLISKFDKKGITDALGAVANFGVQAAKAVAGVVTAMGALSVATIRTALDFNQQFTKIRTLTNLSADDAEYLKDVALQLGPAYSKSAQEAADGLYFVTSAGFDAAESVDILEAALKGSLIGMGDTAVLADLLTSAMYSYRDSNLTAEVAVATLLEALRASKVEAPQLAASLGQVLPIASEMGITFQETSGLLALLTQGGLDAAEAVTSLRGIMTTLLNPTKEARDLLADYGLTVDEVRASITDKGLFETLVMLEDAFGGNTDAMTTLFGNVRALVGTFSILGGSIEDSRGILQGIVGDVDTLNEAVEVSEDDPLNQFLKLWEETKALFLELGNDVLPIINDEVLPALQQFMQELEDKPEFRDLLRDVLDKFIELGPTLIELMPQALEFVELFLEAMEVILPEVNAFLEDMGILFGGEKGIAYGITVAREAWQEFVDNIQSAMDFVNKNLEKHRETWQRIIDAINSAIRAFREFLGMGNPKAPKTSGGSTTKGSGGGRADGGLVTGGTMYAVGERGPELFIPNQNGTIIPNSGMGGNVYNITVNAGMGANGAQLGEEIVKAIRRYERASGPVFASA